MEEQHSAASIGGGDAAGGAKEAPSPERPAAVGGGSETRDLLRKLGPAGLLGIAWTAMPAVMGGLLLWNIERISALLLEDRAVGFAGYVAVFIVSAGLGLLPTYSQAILGGWVFGMALGLPGALAGFVGASVIGYFTAKTVSQHRVEEVIASRPTWKAVRDSLIGGSFLKTLGIVSLIRVPPNSPFALTNLLLSTAGVKLLPFVLGTAIGMLPRTAVAVGLAAAGRSTGAAGLREFIDQSRGSWVILVVGIVVMVVVLGVIGQIANRAIARVTRGAAVARAGAGGVEGEEKQPAAR